MAPDDLVVTTGVREGMAALARLLAVRRDRIAVEEPGWSRLRDALTSAGLRPVGLPVDADGARTGDLTDDLRLAAITPAHHFPTGAVLSPQRRAAALDWAERTDGLLLEDDYDAEFRYDRRPVGVLQGLAPDRVALFGSVSKTLSPAIRIGWVAAPPGWAEALRTAVPEVGTVDQLALARFLAGGGYDRHLRRSRQRYRGRRDLLVTALSEELPDALVSGVAAGLHLVLDLPAGVRAPSVVREAARRGVQVMDLSTCRLSPAGDRSALVLGYGNLPDRLVGEAVAHLAAAVRTAAAG